MTPFIKSLLVAAALFFAVPDASARIVYSPEPRGILTYGYRFWNGRYPVYTIGAGRVRTRYDVWVSRTTGNDRTPKLYTAGSVIPILYPSMLWADYRYIMLQPVL